MARRSRLSKGMLHHGVSPKRLKVWKSAQWAEQAKAEFDAYKKTGNRLKLAQSGEKLWNAFGLRMDDRFGKKYFGIREMKKDVVSSRDHRLLDVFKDAYWLHAFFYRGYTDDVSIEEDSWRNVYDWLKKPGGAS